MTRSKIKIFMLCFLFISCAASKTVTEDPFFEKWKLKAEKSRGHSPSAVIKKLDIPEEKEKKTDVMEEAAKTEKSLSTGIVDEFKLFNEEVVVVLRALARAANQNLVIADNIKGKMSVNVVDTPWDQVFTSILRNQKLTYVIEGEILRVMTLEDRNQMLAGENKLKKLLPLLEPQVIPINYADVTKIQANLTHLLGQRGRDKEGKEGNERQGFITVDEHTNSIVVQATRDDLNNIISLINQLDKPTSQIFIEAHIVETTKSVARDLGIQWGGNLSSALGSGSVGLSGVSVQPTTILDPSSLINSQILANASDIGGSAVRLGLENMGDLTNLEILLTALEKDGKVKILSRPSITTLDNQTAFTENGTRIPFVSLASTGGATIQNVEFVNAVLRLEITPHVIDGKNLKMKIVIKKDEVDESRQVLGNPFIIKKQTETNLIVQDGRTIVISGLTKNTESDTSDGVPEIKNIPWLGWLFKREEKINNMEEVLIFITPHILKKEDKE